MHTDALRTKLDVKFYCSKHPNNELNFSSNLSKIGANSAFEINAKITIHPCSMCRSEKEKIEDAVKLLMTVANTERQSD